MIRIITLSDDIFLSYGIDQVTLQNCCSAVNSGPNSTYRNNNKICLFLLKIT